jgi:hypothetical protein
MIGKSTLKLNYINDKIHQRLSNWRGAQMEKLKQIEKKRKFSEYPGFLDLVSST